MLVLATVARGARRLRELTSALRLASRSSMKMVWVDRLVKFGLLKREHGIVAALTLTETGQELLWQHAVLWKDGRPVQAFSVEAFE